MPAPGARPAQAVGVDVGGTKVAAGVVERSGAVRGLVRLDSPRESGQALADTVVAAVGHLGEAARQLPVGIGAAGLIDRAGMVLVAPNLPWTRYPLQQEMRERLGRPVIVENDANAAMWGEYRVGAARAAASTAAMLTVGTGVGGGVVIDDRLVRGTNGLGAELGHMIVAEGARRCACGNLGCLEAMASGTAIAETAREWLADGRVPSDSCLAHHVELTGVVVGEAAQAGDETACAVLATCGHWLGVGIASVVNALDPEIVVVGGGVAALGEDLLGPAIASSTERIMGQAHRRLPPVVPTALGGQGGLVGAGLLALEHRA